MKEILCFDLSDYLLANHILLVLLIKKFNFTHMLFVCQMEQCYQNKIGFQNPDWWLNWFNHWLNVIFKFTHIF